MIMKKMISCMSLYLAVLFLIGCQADTAQEPRADLVSTNYEDENVDVAAGNTNNDGGYWDGGEWGSQPVVSLEYGISEAAHAEVMACGLTDSSIDKSVESRLELGVPESEESKVVFRALNDSLEPLWFRSITLNSLASDVFLIDCKEETP